eukprot:940495-Karenia_brevis.AAC.1
MPASTMSKATSKDLFAALQQLSGETQGKIVQNQGCLQRQGDEEAIEEDILHTMDQELLKVEPKVCFKKTPMEDAFKDWDREHNYKF